MHLNREENKMNISTHDLTRRSTCSWKGVEIRFSNFNSRPHEEVDRFFRFCPCLFLISTHDLTRRSTISSALEFLRIYFNSRPHEEVDPSLRRQRRIFRHFNSRPHEEVDTCDLWVRCNCNTFQLTTSRGGRLGSVAFFYDEDAISTHDLTRRSTY